MCHQTFISLPNPESPAYLFQYKLSRLSLSLSSGIPISSSCLAFGLSTCAYHPRRCNGAEVCARCSASTNVSSRVRITISINGAAIEQDLVTLDLDLSLTLADLKSLVEVDTNVQAAKQDYFLDGQALKDNTKSLQDLGIKDGEMLFMVVNGGQNASSSSQQLRQPARRTRQQPASDDPARIESIRQQLLNNPTQMTSLIDTAPDLAQVIDNPTQFREAWLARIANDTRERQNHENEIRRLNEDPFNADSQKRIADMIRRENIEKNLQYALENNPAGKTCLCPGSIN